MLRVSDEYLRSIVSDSRDMPYRLTLDGGLVLEKTNVSGLTLNENIGGNSSVAIGTANSATLSFTLSGTEIFDYNGILVEPESGLVLPDGTIEWVPLGKFWITDFSTSNDFKTVKITCSDGMYHMSGKYVSSLTYPAQIKDVVHEIVAQTGIDFIEPSEWPDVVVRRKPEGLTHREAIGHAAGCCGCNARFNRYGKLEFTWYTKTDITINRSIQYLNGLTRLNYKPLEVEFEILGKEEVYEVECITDGNGGVTATPGKSVYEGDTVVLSVVPFANYELALLTAFSANGEEITLYRNANGGFTFIQPDSNVTVTASFRSSATGPFKLTVRGYDGGMADYVASSSGSDLFEEGEHAGFLVFPNDGYVISKIVTTPATLSYAISEQTEEYTAYNFVMPACDVTVNVYFKTETEYYEINRVSSDGGYVYIQDFKTGEYIGRAFEGTVVSVKTAPQTGYVFDRFDADIVLTQVDANTYKFTMPARSVTITALYKFSENEEKKGLYSWLQTPQSPPINKPYWAVFYNESDELPTCQKYYLVWFDSWEVTGLSYGKHKIKFNGYYYCGGKNNGYANHEWDTSLWYGNGALGNYLEWSAYTKRVYAEWDDYYGTSSNYCLLASNIHLIYNGSIIFESCENAIQTPQTSFLVDGMDVREKATLTDWLCPDTFSTPAPASNWMVLMPNSGLYMTVNAENKYETPASSYPKSLIAFFYDDITIQNLGAIFPNTDEVVYVASFTNARWTYLRDGTWDEELHELPENAVVGLRSPLVATRSADGYLDGSDYNFAGVLASSQTLYDTDGDAFVYKNSCRICGCESSPRARMFSLRRTAEDTDTIFIDSTDLLHGWNLDTIEIVSEAISVEIKGDTLIFNVGGLAPINDKVTISYENPMIYQKSVDSISKLISPIVYTPAKVRYRGNPALQAGDIVTAPDKDGVFHTILIMEQTMTFGGGMNAEITCPGKTEKTKSFSSVSPVSTYIKKEVQQSSSEIERRLTSNNNLVFNTMYKEIGDTESKIKAVVEYQDEQTATLAEIEQKTDENSADISLVVASNGAEKQVRAEVIMSAINDDESSVKISADKLDIEGKELNIKVASTNIEGKLTAEQINAKGLQVEEGVFSGELSVQKILMQDKTFEIMSDSDASVTVVDITWHIVVSGMPQKVTAYATIKEPVTQYISDLKCGIWFSSADEKKGYDYGPDTAYINPGETRSSTLTYNLGAKYYNISKYNGTKWVAVSDYGTVVALDSSFVPSEDSVYTLGSSYRKWADVYSLSGSINTSDEREKNSISEISQKYSDMFYKLNPIVYKLNKGTSGRTHVGFSAQQVESAMTECGIDSVDFAGLIKTPMADGDTIYGLRYSEFIALAVLEIQKLNKKITELERQING